ncbi:hypothetical protein MATL_G00080550 [Megalops atlanticus]|uniref:Small ribosomal subunit protein bS16m n=1 Tax=Megalops atlanticus TaxID=7932 RepID=A0A9D3Q5X2_MEGAT|nr:hypothetical protein MATL_G00080550 [Megalops atlanticus]
MVYLSSLLLKQYHGGHVVIRLSMSGCTNRPFYRIVAAYNKRARDSKYIEQLGSYDPLPNIHNEKLVSFNYERIKYWIGCGAHPTKAVAKLLGLAGFFPLHPMTVTNAERRQNQAALAEGAAGGRSRRSRTRGVRGRCRAPGGADAPRDESALGAACSRRAGLCPGGPSHLSDLTFREPHVQGGAHTLLRVNSRPYYGHIVQLIFICTRM